MNRRNFLSMLGLSAAGCAVPGVIPALIPTPMSPVHMRFAEVAKLGSDTSGMDAFAASARRLAAAFGGEARNHCDAFADLARKLGAG